jgi:hypothetical protein
MTDEQKFFFDLRGYLLLPAVLPPAQIEAIREHLYAGGDGFTGPAQELLDHPVVADVLHEILSDTEPAEEYYSFRCENSFTTIRRPDWKSGATEIPHVVWPPQRANAVRYQCRGGKIFSGLTRVVWEINAVRAGEGGTLFLPGSHKANFAWPESVLAKDNPHMWTYECPPGSVIVFTESLLHAATDWKSPDSDRCAVFNCYNSLWSQWHRLNLSHELIESMPEKRRSLFRGVYAHDFTVRPHCDGGNRYYSLTNRSL